MSEQDFISALPPSEESGRIAYLIAQFLQDKLSPNERKELDEWVTASEDNRALFEELIDEKNINQSIDWMKKFDVDLAKKRVHQRLGLKPRKPLWLTLLPYAVAASILLIAGLGLFSYLRREKPRNDTALAVGPAQTKAVLELAEGRNIELDNKGDKTVASGNGYQMVTKGDLLIVQAGAKNSDPVYHSLSTPKGGKYALQLADGSKIWLNADTRLRFPSSFTGKERLVELEGEAYFEVAHHPQQPFLVNLNGARIKVLGTHFNVRGYSHHGITTTLIEGSVEVSTSSSKILTPGQEALVERQTGAITITEGDPESATGWQKGFFVFRDTPVEAMMEEIGRWYNIEVQYAAPVTRHFNGSFDRNVPLTKLLGYLEGTGGVHFQIQDHQVTVGP